MGICPYARAVRLFHTAPPNVRKAGQTVVLAVAGLCCFNAAQKRRDVFRHLRNRRAHALRIGRMADSRAPDK